MESQQPLPHGSQPAVCRHALRDLDAVWEELLAMAHATELLLDTSLRALLAGDVALAREARRQERAIDGREVRLEQQCLRALTLYEPAASDLRRVVVALKVNGSLERVGDLSAHIAKRVKKLAGAPLPDNVRRLVEEAQGAFTAAVAALVRSDPAAARAIISGDGPLDADYHAALAALKQDIARDPDQVDRWLRLVNTARNLERVGDHATNIAEAVLYLAEGVFVRRGTADPGAYRG
jgi:phosphate transport system protein